MSKSFSTGDRDYYLQDKKVQDIWCTAHHIVGELKELPCSRTGRWLGKVSDMKLIQLLKGLEKLPICLSGAIGSEDEH